MPKPRASRESSSSVSKSIATWATEPSGSTTPPWVEPVWTLILLGPLTPAPRSSSASPSMKARSSSAVVFRPPTSPISTPTEIVTPSGSRERMSRKNADESW